MAKFAVLVSTELDVHLDEKKFTREFMEDFRKSFYDFTSLEDHAKHLGQLHARGLVGNGSFIEGYGTTDAMGIVFGNEGVIAELA